MASKIPRTRLSDINRDIQIDMCNSFLEFVCIRVYVSIATVVCIHVLLDYEIIQ